MSKQNVSAFAVAMAAWALAVHPSLRKASVRETRVADLQRVANARAKRLRKQAARLARGSV